jgi:hypothetical protein
MNRIQPPEEKEMMSAEIAPVGQHYPVDRFLDAIAHAYGSKVDGPAIRTAFRKHQVLD